jgi:signal transduction histidine kinase
LFALALLAPLLAYAAAAHATTRTAVTALVSSWVGILAFNFAAGMVSWGDHVFPAVLVTLAWAAGRLARQQRLLAAQVLERNRELEAAGHLETTVASADERLRIARELHDVVAHSLMVMVVQAGAARRSLESGRPGSVEALRVVEETGQASAEELSRLFDLVDPAGRPDQSPGMGHLDELVDRTRVAGLAVDVTTEGVPTSLPGGVDLAAYRIVQESLTNVLRHARATRVQVRVRYEPDAVHVEVSDDGNALTGSTAPPPGNGITGMRERARLYSGTVAAGPRPDGGFLVQAMFPLRPARQEERV